jgi:hypothetical protein
VKARDASVWKICGGETVYSATSSGGPALWTKASVRDGSVGEASLVFFGNQGFVY